MKTKISVVSYKRPNNSTCNLLMNTSYDWCVYVYKFDPFFNEYIKNYGNHVRPITEFDKPSLPKKRDLVLYEAMKDSDYCIMLDDDVAYMKNLKLDKEVDITDVISYLEYSILKHPEYIALSTCYNRSDELEEIVDYKNICNNSIFNLSLLKETDVHYNPASKCEDMEFSIDLMLKGYKTGRLDYMLVKNTLQGGTTNDGLSYRFSGTNRFVEEAEYMRNRYPELKDVFEYDENHFKMNTNKLIEVLK